MKELGRLKEITDTLRGPGGCEWDLKQNYMSMREDLLEEAYELIDAVNRNDIENMEEELGDVLFLLLFYARMGEESGDFTLETAARKVGDKLIRRHPHVFADEKVENVNQILYNWEQIKRTEKGISDTENVSLMTAQDYGFLPALKRAFKLQKKAARTGFDWQNLQPVIEKLDEEIDELKIAIKNKDDPGHQQRIADELGDVLFSAVNLARHLNLEPELCLHETIEKFISRINYIEKNLNSDMNSASIEKMDLLWNQAKSHENSVIK